MADISEIEPLAIELDEKDIAILAAHLLQSLPPVIHDEDQGIAEALRRDAEIASGPGKIVSMADVEGMVKV